MNNLNHYTYSSFEEKDSCDEKQKDKKLEKILCNHCGRTSSNGIRCLGICVADNEY